MYETLGGISGATLGYITHGTRGALAGWNIGKYLGKRKREKVSQMAPTYGNKTVTGKRKNSYSSIGSSTASALSYLGRTNKYLKVKPRLSPLVIRRRPTVHVQGVGAGAVKVQRSKKSVKLLAKKKRIGNVKVSKNLRKKIKKVISGQAIIGYTQEISYGVQRLITTADNSQIVSHITTSNAAPGNSNAHFSNSKIMDAASCLWNNKLQAENPKSIGDAGNFDAQKLKVKVIDSSVTYNFKNNSMRKVNCRLIELRPKSLETAGNPFDGWIAALAQNIIVDGPNQSGINVSQLYTNPGMLPDMRNVWNISTTKFEMAPGTEYKHYVAGPKDKLLDFKKMWNGGTFRNMNKDAVFTILITIPDLCTTFDADEYGRYQNATLEENSRYGIVFEAVTRYKMEMPEQTGFTVPASIVAGTSVPNSQRQFSYAYRTYGITRSTGEGTGLIAINDENPVIGVAAP